MPTTKPLFDEVEPCDNEGSDIGTGATIDITGRHCGDLTDGGDQANVELATQHRTGCGLVFRADTPGQHAGTGAR